MFAVFLFSRRLFLCPISRIFSPTSAAIMTTLSILCTLLVMFTVLSFVYSKERQYKLGEKVDIFMNKVGPHYNPHETYAYYDVMPVCVPEKLSYESLSLSQVLNGDRRVKSDYQATFGETVRYSNLCVMKMTSEDLREKFRHMITELYSYEIYVDDIVAKGFVGEYRDSRFSKYDTNMSALYNDISINIAYNNMTGTIVSVNISTNEHTSFDLCYQSIPYSVLIKYDIVWSKTDLTREEALKRDFPQQHSNVRRFSLLNSIIISVFLTSLTVTVIRKARRDLCVQSNVEKLACDVGVGVYAFPCSRSLLSSLLGVGSQLIFIFLSMVVYKFTWYYKNNEGTGFVALLLLYVVSSFIGGYVSSSYYRKMHGSKWARNIILTAFLFTAPFFLIWGLVNFTHWAYGTTHALPYTTILIIISGWVVLGFSLNLCGGILGKNRVTLYEPPFGVETTLTEVPLQPWYKRTICHIALGGFGFSVTFIELFFFMSAMWEQKIYVIEFWVLIAQLFLLVWVTCCVSIFLTNMQILSRNVYWWWRAFLCGCSVGFYAWLYSIIFYCKRSLMSGMVQGVTYFGAMFLFSLSISLMCGTISFIAAFAYIRYRLSISNLEFPIKSGEAKQLEVESS